MANQHEERAAARERQRRRRAKMVDAGVPSTHAINRALVEALLYCAERNRRTGTARAETTIEIGAVFAHASLVLIVGNGHSRELDPEEVHRVMKDRFRPRPRKWTIRP
jgi:hypothetical protein